MRMRRPRIEFKQRPVHRTASADTREASLLAGNREIAVHERLEFGGEPLHGACER
jgi:hypothetical protein